MGSSLWSSPIAVDRLEVSMPLRRKYASICTGLPYRLKVVVLPAALRWFWTCSIATMSRSRLFLLNSLLKSAMFHCLSSRNSNHPQSTTNHSASRSLYILVLSNKSVSSRRVSAPPLCVGAGITHVALNPRDSMIFMTSRRGRPSSM